MENLCQQGKTESQEEWVPKVRCRNGEAAHGKPEPSQEKYFKEDNKVQQGQTMEGVGQRYREEP